MIGFKKAKKDKAPQNGGRNCSGCGMPVTDGSWLVCPRCRVVLENCSGCSNCGRCQK